MNAQYNVACAPPGANGMLSSLCQDQDQCPLAAPSPDCAPYQDLQPNGVVSSAASTASTSLTATFTPSSVPPQSIIDTTATAAAASGASTTPSAPATTTSSSDNNNHTGLTSGAIAGIAVGAGAGVILLAAAIFYGLRQRKPSGPSGANPQAYQSNQYSPTEPKNGPTGYASPIMSEDYSRFLPSYTQEQVPGQPQFQSQYQEPHSPPVEVPTNPVYHEMGGNEVVQGPYMGPGSGYTVPGSGHP